MSFTETEPLLTTAEAGALLRLTTQTIRAYVRSGRLKAERITRQLRIRPSALEDFLAKQRSE